MTAAYQIRPAIEISTDELMSRVAFLNPKGFYSLEVSQAKAELEKRGVDYSACLELEPL